MKTNIILNSSDRNLFGVTIRQNTKNEYLSLTDLQKAYEKGKWSYGWTGQNYNQLLQTDIIAKKCFGVLKELELINCDISQFMEMVKKETLVKVLKNIGVYSTSGRGETKSVMVHPYIWMTVSLELNYILHGKVISWVSDTLIFDRIDAGSEYLPMNSAIKSIIKNPNYPLYARTINEKVFSFHKSGMRNIANARELRKIANIEKFVINAIDMKFIKTEDEIINAIKNFKI